MLRLVERVLGEGDLYREGTRLTRTGYEPVSYTHLTLPTIYAV